MTEQDIVDNYQLTLKDMNNLIMHYQSKGIDLKQVKMELKVNGQIEPCQNFSKPNKYHNKLQLSNNQ
ncbi:hypothetical protein H3997_11080 [Staphylococcus epidermidis]|mgnify:CR=1 FL=1|uniref:hypothetical protein n=1 Tax=Staphylococcus TaxID=1279 RepID=UPI000F3DC0B0|nr:MULTISPECIES: hypothetical protein [Staphylococcus]MBF2142270.1 hypothetical protein [Staphylococcus epidermidis]MBF2226359.1 hypothetical protein [Staphylococcus epidermidis]MCD9074477.1 hypothetical protein [Staphylococcus epidermidis]MCG1072142.1 hypothetical protein [Staphylococcus epidermidis]RNG65144.1 hypothetical protein D1G04_13865 [Staphylococcus aureus]